MSTNKNKYHSEIVGKEPNCEKAEETLSQTLTRILEGLTSTESFVYNLRNSLYSDEDIKKLSEPLSEPAIDGDGSIESKILNAAARITDINCELKLIISRL